MSSDQAMDGGSHSPPLASPARQQVIDHHSMREALAQLLATDQWERKEVLAIASDLLSLAHAMGQAQDHPHDSNVTSFFDTGKDYTLCVAFEKNINPVTARRHITEGLQEAGVFPKNPWSGATLAKQQPATITVSEEEQVIDYKPSPAATCTVFVSPVHPDIDLKAIITHRLDKHQAPLHVRRASKAGRNFAFVAFREPAHAQACIQHLHGFTINNVKTSFAPAKQELKPRKPNTQPTNSPATNAAPAAPTTTKPDPSLTEGFPALPAQRPQPRSKPTTVHRDELEAFKTNIIAEVQQCFQKEMANLFLHLQRDPPPSQSQPPLTASPAAGVKRPPPSPLEADHTKALLVQSNDDAEHQTA